MFTRKLTFRKLLCTFILITCTLVLTASVEAQNLVWAKAAGGNYGADIAALDDGSAWVTGYFLGTATFGPGESGETTLTSAGNYDMFIARYNPDATLAWAKRAGGTVQDTAWGIAVLSDGTALVTGTVDVTPKSAGGKRTKTTLTSAGNGDDIFVAKYNPEGIQVWEKRTPASFGGRGRGIAVLSDGSALVTGMFLGIATFGSGESGETALTSAGWSDIFVAKYNANGTLAWAKGAGGASQDNSYGIAALSDGSALVTGWFKDTATFGPGESGETVLTTPLDFDWDVFIAKYNPNGTLAWAKRAGGYGNDRGNDIAALSNGSALITGKFEGTAVFGAGETGETILTSAAFEEIFIAKYNPNGTLAWAKSAGGTWMDYGHGIAVLPDGCVLVTGEFYETATFGLGESDETILTSDGGEDIFVARYNPNGTLAWARRAGGSGSDVGYGIATLSEGSALVMGRFYETATFGEGESNETTLTYAEGGPIFIAKYAGAPPVYAHSYWSLYY